MEHEAELAPPVPLSPADEAHVICAQKLIRGRLACKRGEARAGELYRKCWDALSGFEYYCNLRTGASMWQKPMLLGASDANWIEPATLVVGFEAGTVAGTNEATRDDPCRMEADPFPLPHLKLQPEPPKTAASMTQRKQRFDDGVAFQQQRTQEKLTLMKKHRRKIARHAALGPQAARGEAAAARGAPGNA